MLSTILPLAHSLPRTPQSQAPACSQAMLPHPAPCCLEQSPGLQIGRMCQMLVNNQLKLYYERRQRERGTYCNKHSHSLVPRQSPLSNHGWTRRSPQACHMILPCSTHSLNAVFAVFNLLVQGPATRPNKANSPPVVKSMSVSWTYAKCFTVNTNAIIILPGSCQAICMVAQ